jgi:hypothetical protein
LKEDIMKKTTLALLFVLYMAVSAMPQSNPPIKVKEVDGFPSVTNPTELIFPNGSLTINGKKVTIATGGSGSSPGGSNTQVQFNDSGSFAGDAGLVYNKTTNFLTVIGGGITLSSSTINNLTLTPPATGSTLTILNGKTLTINNSLTFTGTDGSTLNIGAGGTLGSNAFTSTSYTPAARNINTTSPITGGGDLSGDRTIVCATCTTNASALTSNLPVIGGGGNAVAVGTRSGNTTRFVSMDASTPATNDCAKFDANGNLTTAGTACGSGGGITNSAGNNVIPVSNGTNIVSSSITDNGTIISSTELLNLGGGTNASGIITGARSTVIGDGNLVGNGTHIEIDDSTTTIDFSGTVIMQTLGPTSLHQHTIPDITSSTFALYSNKLNVFAATTSAELFGVISNETGGGGVLVGNSSPIIITPNLTTGFTIGGAAASRKIIVGNGTNFVASTETYPVPGTSGNIMTSDGTNWTSAASITVSGLLTASGGQVPHVRRVSADTTQLTTDYITAFTSTAAARNYQLLAASAVTTNQVFCVIDESDAAATNNITITRAGSDVFIDGGTTTKVITTNSGSLCFYSTGSAWKIF